jgi:hypothetical protein
MIGGGASALAYAGSHTATPNPTPIAADRAERRAKRNADLLDRRA